jgi:hypothetical protein
MAIGTRRSPNADLGGFGPQRIRRVSTTLRQALTEFSELFM